MPSRMKLRAAKLRMPSQFVVRSFASRRSSQENVDGSDFTSQYRRSPGARGVKTAAHPPPSFFAGLAAAFFAAVAFPGFAVFWFFFADAFFAVPVDFFPPVRLPLPDDAISCLVIVILVALICSKWGQILNGSFQRGQAALKRSIVSLTPNRSQWSTPPP